MSVSFPAVISEGGQKPFLLQPDTLYKLKYTLELSETQPLTEPYWLSYAGTTGAYHFDSAYANLPVTPNNFAATLNFNILGQSVSVKAPISFKDRKSTRLNSSHV